MTLRWFVGLFKIPAAFIVLLVLLLHFWFCNLTSYLEDDLQENIYDFIVVGAGSAGSVISARLSENGSYSVLLLEAGGYPSPLADIPLLAGILPLTHLAYNYQTEPQKGHKASIGKKSVWPRGRVLGGSSVLNFMLYVRGNKYDYDQWAALGNEGWSYDDLLPFFIKSEDNSGLNIEEQYHGRDGNLKVEDRVWRSNLPKAFIDAGLQLGYSQIDINGKNQTGFVIPQLTAERGARSSTYSAYLKNARNYPSLKVVTFAHVQKVLIDETKQAYGIQYRKHGRLHTVFATREIILSGGAVGSPQILMLSGVGPKQHLEQLKIPVFADRRVGDNLQDHVYVPLTPLVHNDNSASLVNPTDITALWNYLFYGKGQYTSTGVDGMAFKASKYSDRPDWPDIQLHFLSYSAASDHGIFVRKVLGMEENAWREMFDPFSYVDTASIFATLVRPKSRGTIRLRSADPSDDPIIDPQYYSVAQDVRVMMEALKFGQETLNTTAMKGYMKLQHSEQHPCQKFPKDTDSYLECLIEYTSATLHHPAGTCKMGGSSDPEAVVDPQLRVYGIKGLRVADASVMPIIPNGNINAPVIMIGEKAAHIILEHHKNCDESCKIKHTNIHVIAPSLKDEL